MVEKVRAEELERQLQHETWQRAVKQHAAEAQRRYDEALAEARAAQRQAQVERIRARVAGDPSIVSFTVDGASDFTRLPLDPQHEQRAAEAARVTYNRWLETHPAPSARDVRV